MRATLLHRPKTSTTKLFLFMVGCVVVGISVLYFARASGIAGDLNNDGVVDVYDLSIFLSKWGTSDATADLNHDGTVNILDLSIILSHWGQAAGTPTPTPTLTPTPTPTPTPSTHHMAVLMYASWISMSNFQQMVAGNLTPYDQIRYRVTSYPTGYDPGVVTALQAIKVSEPGLKLGIDIAYYTNIVQYAAQIKSEGFDFVEYDLESSFDGPSGDSAAAQNLSQIQQAATAVHAQGMQFRVTPGKPNSTAFLDTGLLGDVANAVDYYQIQAQAIQTSGPAVYSAFTDSIASVLKTAKPSLVVTSQVSPGQGAAAGETVLQTMEDDVGAAMAEPTPGDTDGASMWISSSDVPVATSFFSWFHSTYP